jgi:hypothetical protein
MKKRNVRFIIIIVKTYYYNRRKLTQQIVPMGTEILKRTKFVHKIRLKYEGAVWWGCILE